MPVFLKENEKILTAMHQNPARIIYYRNLLAAYLHSIPEGQIPNPTIMNQIITASSVPDTFEQPFYDGNSSDDSIPMFVDEDYENNPPMNSPFGEEPPNIPSFTPTTNRRRRNIPVPESILGSRNREDEPPEANRRRRHLPPQPPSLLGRRNNRNDEPPTAPNRRRRNLPPEPPESILGRRVRPTYRGRPFKEPARKKQKKYHIPSRVSYIAEELPHDRYAEAAGDKRRIYHPFMVHPEHEEAPLSQCRKYIRYYNRPFTTEDEI